MGRGDGGWSRLDECNPCFRQLPVLAFEACANILAGELGHGSGKLAAFLGFILFVAIYGCIMRLRRNFYGEGSSAS
jgi:hypothetical protein